MSFQKKIFIPFHLADPAGILFFGNTFALAHEALENYITNKLGLDWSDWFMNVNWIAPIKEAHADFRRPIYAGNAAIIIVEVIHVGQSSVKFKYSFQQNGEFCSELTSLHVFCDRALSSKIDIPPHIRDRFIAKKIVN